MPTPLTREQILGAPHAPPRPVEVPEWGGVVLVRVMNGKERESFEKVYLASGRTDIRATLLAATIVDEQGNPMFSASDVVALNRLDAPPLMRLYDVALEMNRVTEDQIEELASNSDANHSGSSPTGSPSDSAG